MFTQDFDFLFILHGTDNEIHAFFFFFLRLFSVSHDADERFTDDETQTSASRFLVFHMR